MLSVWRKTGTINLDEMIQLIRSMNINVSKFHATSLFHSVSSPPAVASSLQRVYAQIDGNGNHSLDKAEFEVLPESAAPLPSSHTRAQIRRRTANRH
jgi:hypothetical protein